MPKKTAREALDGTLNRLKAEVPASFAEDAALPIHPNLQRFFAARGLTAASGPFDLLAKKVELIDLYAIPYSAPRPAPGNRGWVVLAETKNHQLLGVLDPAEEDPAVFVVDAASELDDRTLVPKSWRAVGPFSEVISKWKRRPVEKKSTAAIELEPLAPPPAPLRYQDQPRMVGGERFIAATSGGNPNAAAFMVFDGHLEGTPVPAELTPVHCFGLAGSTIVAIGRTADKRHQVRAYEVVEGSWRSAEIFTTDQFGPSGQGPFGHFGLGQAFAAGGDTFAYSIAPASGSGSVIVVWRRTGATWKEHSRVATSAYVTKLAISRDGQRLAVQAGHEVVEYALEESTYREVGRVVGSDFALDGGALFVMSDGAVVVYRRGQEVARLAPSGKKHALHCLAVSDGRVAVTGSADTATGKDPGVLVGWQARKSDDFVQVVERSGVHREDPDPRRRRVQASAMAFAGNRLVLSYGILPTELRSTRWPDAS